MTERGEQLHHNITPAHSTALVQAFRAKHHITMEGLSAPPTVQNWLNAASWFSKAKIAVENEIYKCDGHTVHKLSQRRLTAE
jgi:hypothetical protein